MIQVNFNLKHPKSEKATLIFLVMRHSGQELKVSTQLKVPPLFWNKNRQRLKKSYPDSKLFNSLIDQFEIKVKKAVMARKLIGEAWSLDEIKTELFGKKKIQNNTPKSLTGFFESFIKSKINVHRPGTIISYQNALRTIKSFLAKTKTKDHLNAVNMEFYNDLLGFLYAPPRYSSLNNAGKVIKHLKTVMNEAVSLGATQNYTFKSKGFKKPYQKVNHIYLSMDEIKLIREIQLQDEFCVECRDILIFLCFTGLRFSDLWSINKSIVKELDQSGNYALQVLTKKTGALVVIPLHPIAKSILEKYEYNLPKTYNTKFNRAVKKVARLAGLDSTVNLLRSRSGKPIVLAKKKYEVVSSHIGRRSFITNMYLSKIDSHSIRLISGHQSEKEFENYIKVTLEQNSKQLLQHPFFKTT